MAIIPDYSIIFLKPTLEQVYGYLDDTPIANIFNRDYITLSPNEFYTQITNVQDGINMGADAKVELVDCCDRVLVDITSKTTISQWNHIVTGKSQMTYEIVNIGQAFNVPVHLKFTQQTNPDNVFYSNPFKVSNDLAGTTRIDYSGFGVMFGWDWATPNVKCSIRVKGYFTKYDPKTARQSYLATNGTTLSLYDTPSIPKLFNVEYQDNYGLRAFEYISYLCSSVVYLRGKTSGYGLRCTKIEPTSEGVLGSSNFFKAAFGAYMSDTDDYTPIYQITPNFALTSKYPLGIYRDTEIPTEIIGTFNYPIVLGTGVLSIIDEDGEVVIDYTQDDIVVVGSTFTIDISALSLANGNYYINFTSGLFNNAAGQTYSILENNDDLNEWPFTIAGNRYDSDRYEPTRYL